MANTIHLYKVENTYYFRCRIPKDLQVWFKGKRDHKRKLQICFYLKQLSKYLRESGKTINVLIAL